MTVQNKSFSIQPMNALGGMLCLALMACQGAVYGTGPEKPDKADVQNNGARVRLRDEPALRKPISGEFRDPKAQDIF